MTLLIANRQRTRKIKVRALKEITTTLLMEMAGPDATLEINLVSPAQMARVNKTHLQHEGPTDVITFGYGEDMLGAVKQDEPAAAVSRIGSKSTLKLVRKLKRPKGRAPGALHGELFICPEVAVEQSREFHTDWRSELVRYVIHGLLHLLGHDDLEPVARRRMKRAEGRLLTDISRRFALRKL